MKVCELKSAPDPELNYALQQFEQQFTYPLGTGRSFHIQHSPDYSRFYRAIGDNAVSFVAESEGRVLGVVSIAIRKLLLLNGNVSETAYIGDLKIAPITNRGPVLLKLAQATDQWARQRVATAFAVVMDGTTAIPPRYTGRMKIPLFQEVAKIKVLQITPRSTVVGKNVIEIGADEEKAKVRFSKLSAGRYACVGGFSTLRSEIEPQWLVAKNGQACALLEDTRKAKRLITSEGNEIGNAHLSYFAFADMASAIDLLKVACQLAIKTQHSGLFVAISEADASRFLHELKDLDVIVAPATIYGFGFENNTLWNINTAEI